MWILYNYGTPKLINPSSFLIISKYIEIIIYKKYLELETNDLYMIIQSLCLFSKYPIYFDVKPLW